ncbi:hypothetical protein [Allocoleopsis sp.]
MTESLLKIHIDMKAIAFLRQFRDTHRVRNYVSDRESVVMSLEPRR